ncbi:MAG: serine/threonine-protein phosphatase [Magnetococcales bacterium]|nr:serine/threonine-protein phosphatase [Magnetococcales bacterium]
MIQSIGDTLMAAGKTDVGCLRTLNEDNLLIDEQLGLLIIADGMGGHSAGEVASAQVIRSICHSLQEAIKTPPQEITQTAPPQDNDTPQGDDEPTIDRMPNPIVGMIRSAANAANSAINTINRAEDCADGTGMGSTLVGLWLPSFSEVPVIFHVGDSRLYHFRQGKMTQVTQDHSMYQRWLNMGGKGMAPAQNILLQAVGPTEHVTPDIHFKEMEQGDIILLCSDGLTGMVSIEAIQDTLATARSDNLDSVVDQLVEMAREGGGKDNISVIVGYFLK